jgi:uncharacterized protein YjbI with pentapeptide repeats
MTTKNEKEGVASETTTTNKNEMILSTDFTEDQIRAVKSLRPPWRNANLRNAFFDLADLLGARFNEADLRRACFVEALLTDATFYRANLSHATFRAANMSGTHLCLARFDGAEFRDADLSKAKNLHKAKLPEGWREALEAAGLIPKELGDFDERLRGIPYLLELQDLL